MENKLGDNEIRALREELYELRGKYSLVSKTPENKKIGKRITEIIEVLENEGVFKKTNTKKGYFDRRPPRYDPYRRN